MIDVVFTPTSVEMKGHAHYANAGDDIVCAAASAIAITILQAMESFIPKRDVVLQDDDGYLYFEMTTLQPIAAALLLSMKKTLQQLASQFPQEIRVKETPLK